MMRADKTKTDRLADLRAEAQARLASQVARLQDECGGNTDKLVHELQVHQIELEMQNEELRRAQEELEQSRARYCNLYDFAPVGYMSLDAGGLIVEANLTGCQMLGIERKFLLGKPFSSFVDKQSQDAFHKHRLAASTPGLSQTCEITLVRKDGGKIEVQLESAAATDAEGNLTGCRTIVTDISERKCAQESHRLSEQKFHGLFNTMSEAVVLFELIRNKAGKTVDCRVLDANPAVEKMTGIVPADAIGRTMRQLFPDTDDFWFDTYGQVEATGQPASFERRFDPLNRVYRTSIYRPAPGQIAIVFTDVTEHMRIQEELQWDARRDELLSKMATRLLESKDSQVVVEEICRQVMDFLDCHVFFNYLMDEQAGRLHLNACAGIPEEQVRKIRWLDYGVAVCGCVARDRQRIIAEDIQNTTDPRTELVKSFGIQAYCCHPLIVQGKLTGTLSFGTRTRPRLNPDHVEVMQEVTSLVAIAMSRMETEKALRDSEQRLKRSQEIAHLGSWELDVVNDRLTWSDEVYHIFGLRAQEFAATYEAFLERVHPDDRAAVDAAYSGSIREGRDVYEIEHRVVQKDTGEVRWVHEKCEHFRDASGTIIRSIGMVHDVTETRRAEREIFEVHQRLEAIMKAVPVGISYSLDPTCRQITGNPAVLAQFEVKPQDNLSASSPTEADAGRQVQYFRDGRPISDKELPLQRAVAENREIPSAELEVVLPSGKRWFAETSAAPIRDRQGRVVAGVAVTVDITERKHAAEQIEVMARFPSENPSPVLRIASDGTITYSNGPGLSVLEQWGREVGQKAPPDWCKRVAHALDSGRNIVRQIKCGKRFVSVVVAPVIRGQYVNLYGRDITRERKVDQALRKVQAELEKKVRQRTEQIAQTVGILQEEVQQRMQAEQTARAERHRFSAVLETLPVYVCLLTPDYHMPFANRVFRELFGEAKGRRCFEFLFNKTEACENCETYKVLKSDQPHRWEWTGPNGSTYDVFDFPFKDTDGSQLILEMGIDITERKQAQEQLRQASLYARGLLEASPDPLVTISADGKITDVNEATVAVTGVSRQQLVGTDFSNYFTEPQKAQEGYQQVFAEGLVTDYPLTIRHRNGRLTDVLYNATVYRDSQGNVAGVFAAARDITEKKITEQELEKYRMHLEDVVKQRTQELARSNKDLEQFAYVASHDLQEPLRAVAGFVELLKRNLQKSLDAKTTKYMDFTVDGVMRMQSLISGLLEYSRIGTHGKEPRKIDASAALERAMANLEASIEESKAQVTAASLPIVYFDDVQLCQLFQNLIGNAIKFHGKKPPCVHISAARIDDSWRFAVEDNGIGIDPRYAERIFLIFQRLHNREEYPGTGIGLAICKKIVERHNGKIWVESTPGQGSTFYFTIPVGEGRETRDESRVTSDESRLLEKPK